MPTDTNPDEVKLLSDDEVVEVAAMFPHAEYQPDAEVMPLCSFCDGSIDDHKANCVVPHVHTLCATVRALRAEHEWLRRTVNSITAENTALREQLAQRTIELERESRETQKWNNRANQLAIEGQDLRQQLAQVTQERDELRKCDACERKAIERACRLHGGRP